MRMSYNKASLWSGIGFALCFQCANADSSIPFTVLWTASQGPAVPTYQAITTREQWVPPFAGSLGSDPANSQRETECSI
jgi:hypothetical protein